MSELLERINRPSELKKLAYPELEQLSAEIREEMVRTVSANGGHLASSLGAVELTLALHRVFDSPEDKIVWDVGHQSYSHKLLTGRRGRFSTLRQYGGLSGFPARSESPHDAFGAGHAGTSVSAALGMALARDLAGKKHHVVAVIGDGSIGSGMAFEAINHAGHLGARMTVVLNDNGMSISPSVGVFARLLNQARFDPRYESAKRRMKKTVASLPFGDSAWELSRQIKSRVERAVIPGAFWEQMGFVYLGPVDGHNVREIEAALRRARDFESRPTLVHVITQKGKGYPAAEDDATGFHGVAPGNARPNGKPSYSSVFGKTVCRLMSSNEKVVAITAAMVDGTGLKDAAARFPGRVFDVGICEQHGVTLAAGLASQGYVPIVAIYSTFLQRAYDQIVHDVCIQDLPVVFAIDRAGIVGDDGKTHQGPFDISYLRSIPSMTVCAPKDENELQRMLFTAVEAKGPVAVRYPRGYGMGVEMDPEFVELPIGKGEILRAGRDLVILGIGSMVYPALDAATRMAKEGVESYVVNARFAKPIDVDLVLEMARRTGRVITVEENTLAGGFGSAVLELLAKHVLGKEIRTECIAIPDRFVEHGPQELFRAMFDLDAEGIARRAVEAFPELKAGAWIGRKGRT